MIRMKLIVTVCFFILFFKKTIDFLFFSLPNSVIAEKNSIISAHIDGRIFRLL